MPLQPGYGETPVPDEELRWLQPQVRELLGSAVTLLDIYDYEQAIQQDLTQTQLSSVIAGDLGVSSLLSDTYLRHLHRSLYNDIWQWAGTYRRHEINIGVAPELVAVEVRQGLDSIAYRWEHTDDWTPRVLGMAVHAEIVRIHPFTDGNGRTTRLLADLVFAAAQGTESPDLFDWDVDKADYIALLRQYDRTRDPTGLASLIGCKPLGE
ncbi:Fido, protein-threonine AMPylation domain-containing protein [Quadrisphaera granulorum]|uniref:Fido (Protein-threonine AMPylation protein) n=1 Tax=Quadrisphaera granulorum TaxID=317664 RepID=A0A315ZIN9_9ACTN|nr:Fic family protein [Quadrisphaera granulorum]PWJ45162.1 fido (protein-threonine AMPylation protein) [Quadrisphaera granulorum]SZE99186.1 Fido, protein-threonine AMPylation domain-containing protein [Quadrisphaera granulorum]